MIPGPDGENLVNLFDLYNKANVKKTKITAKKTG